VGAPFKQFIYTRHIQYINSTDKGLDWKSLIQAQASVTVVIVHRELIMYDVGMLIEIS
jgi:hypothetical protein